MRRRTFLATLPLATAGTLAAARNPELAQEGPAPGQQGPLPKFQAPGEERFLRPDVHAGDRPSGASFTTRSPALGCAGAAGTAHPLATQAAIEMLKRGGSAVDAAIAANALLGFVEPVSSGLGGDCFAMVWDPKLSKVVSMASSGKSPQSLTLATARSRAIDAVLPRYGAISVSTPGALDGWWALHQRYGKLPWAMLFEPAIHYCEDGAPNRKSSAGTFSAIWLRSCAKAPALKKPPTPCKLTPPMAGCRKSTTSAVTRTSAAPIA